MYYNERILPQINSEMSDFMSIKFTDIKRNQGLLALLIFAVSLALYHYLAFDTAPVGREYKFTAIGGISAGQSGRRYIIDNGRKDLIIANENCELIRVIHGEHQSTGFMYATGVKEAANGDFYVMDIVYDGTSTRIKKERILRYRPDFTFVGIVYEENYAPGAMPHLYGTFRELKPIDDELSIIRVDGEHIEHILLNPDTGKLNERQAATISEGIIDATYNRVGKGIYVSTKQRNILRIDTDGTVDNIYSQGFPWAVKCFDGRFYYTDAITAQLKCPRLLDPIVAQDVYANGFAVTGDKILYYQRDTVYELDPHSTRKYSSLPLDRLPLRLFLQFLIAASAVAMVLVLIREYRQHMIERVITDNTLPKRMSTVLGMIVLTGLLVTAVVINLFMNELTRADDAALASSFRYTADLMAKKIPADTLLRLSSQQDHTSPEYVRLKSELDDLVRQWQSSKGESSESYYTYNLIYLTDGKVAQLMNREDTFVPGRILPLTEAEYYLRAASENSPTFVFGEPDAYGTWSYYFCPLQGSDGYTIGGLVLAAKVDALKLLRQAKYREIALSAVMTVIIAVVSIIEVFFFLVHWVDKQAKRKKRRHICDYAPIRLLEFLRSLQLGLVTPFLIRSFATLAGEADLTNPLWITLPFSLSFVAGMIATLFSGRFFDRQGSNMSLFLGHSLYLPAGLLFLTTESYLPWLTAYLLGGFAWEFTANSMAIMAAATESAPARVRALSDLMSGRAAGTAAGTGLGSVILTFFSVRTVFEIYTAIALICLLLVALSRNYLPKEKDDARKAAASGGLRARDLIFNKETFGVLFLMFLVISLLRPYRDVALPLYSMEENISVIELGRVMMIACLCATYLAPVIIRTLREHFGNRHAAVVSNITMVAPLLLLPFIPSKYTVYLACLFIEMFYAAGRPYQNGLFMSLASVQAAGPSVAQTVFGLVSTAGSALGPTIFSILFGALGLTGGNVALAIITVACALLFLATSKKELFIHGPAAQKPGEA